MFTATRRSTTAHDMAQASLPARPLEPHWVRLQLHLTICRPVVTAPIRPATDPVTEPSIGERRSPALGSGHRMQVADPWRV